MTQIIQSIPYPDYTTIERDALVDVKIGYKIKNSDISYIQMWDGNNWCTISVAYTLCFIRL